LIKKRTTAKSRTHKSELERLREENRRLEGVVRDLKKQLSRKNKITAAYEDHLIDNDETYVDWKTERTCQDCGKGELKETSLGIRTLTTCSVCNYQKITKS